MDDSDLGHQRLNADAEIPSDLEEEYGDRDDSSDDSNDDEEDQMSISDPDDFIQDRSQPARLIAIREARDNLRDQLRRNTIRKLENTIRVLEERKHARLHTKVVWPKILNLWKEQERKAIFDLFAHLEINSYEDIYMLSIKEGNMNAEKTHPDLRLHQDWPFNEAEEDQFMMTGCRSLPLEVQAKTLFHCFSFSKTLHAVSRLPITEPDMADFPRNKQGKITYFRRFHFGSESVCHRPDTLLAPLLVNKNWHFWGCHFFYGNNTFAFSSLGEFERFATGIGGSKIKLLTSLELLWTGCQFLTNPPSQRGRFTSRRTDSLKWLPLCVRLESLTIWVQESDRMYQRRRHETSSVIGFMNKLTLAQPNKRARRSLRCLQGIDYVYCLRGLKEIKVFDYDKTPMKVAIADQSFQEDLENSVLRKKERTAYSQSKLMNLTPLVSGWEPDGQVWQCLDMLQYEGRQSRTRRSSFDMDSPSLHDDESDSDNESWDSQNESSDTGDGDEDTICGDGTSDSDDESSGRPGGGHFGIRETIDLTMDDDEENQGPNVRSAGCQSSSSGSPSLFVSNSNDPPSIKSPSVKQESRGASGLPGGSPDGSSESSLFVCQSSDDRQSQPDDEVTIDLTGDSDAEANDESMVRKRSSDEETGSVTPKRLRQEE
ncbi:hypothetical protein L249_3304 [Ophiocordyceps polyrhachis-furcata BCC 54312]|uniref:Uncharacterized protein n=1 Tax=Ophiocordyceps polyrhachis-furcata BCC 54312 TaxID=1330021 RepID=A0A367LSP9_9HYPO|nr:hypothetical protein L249_3304 [Ophiocordyceps polyrhachis-furcata BCC 54312]